MLTHVARGANTLRFGFFGVGFVFRMANMVHSTERNTPTKIKVGTMTTSATERNSREFHRKEENERDTEKRGI